MDRNEDDSHDSAFGTFLTAAAFIGLGWIMQGQFAALEAGEAESVKVWWVAAVLYKTLGAKLTVGLFYLFGGLFAIGWIKKLLG